jgi:fructokinase
MTKKVVSIGELLFDIFPDGERLGGAPSNFAYHIAAQGGDVHLISAVGEDDRGASAQNYLKRAGVDVSGVRSTPEKQTGIVSVSLDQNGQPAYDIVEDVAWDRIGVSPASESIARDAAAICWGTLGQRSCRSQSAHRQLFDFAPENCLCVCDINFRQNYHTAEVVTESLEEADLLKLNDEEIPVLRAYVGGTEDPREFLRELRHRYNIPTIVLTLGARGCRVSADNVDFSEPGIPVDVVNTVGSGDAFTAGFVLQMLEGADLKTCAQHANRVGSYVATQDSGMPDIPDHLRP